MPLVQKTVDGLYKGVTTQEPSNRLDGQVEESINMLHSVEKGVSRRNPTELINTLSGVPNDTFIHSYERGDGSEEYIILLSDGAVKVFDTLGIERTVTASAGTLAYLDLVDPTTASENFRMITVGDTTFIVNKTKVCAMSATVDGVLDSHLDLAFYWAKRSFDNGADEGYKYTVQDVTAMATSTETAVTLLQTSLNALTPPINYEVYGSSLIYPARPTSWKWSDSYGSLASEGFWGVAENVNDLPRTLSGAEEVWDFILEIQGDPTNAYTNFWVQYAEGHWKETYKRGLQNTIDNTTMPIKLVSQADGTFTLELVTYGTRRFGDENTASNPSFIDSTISDIFFFKNRLCFVSRENTIMSEVGEYFNFYPTTVTDVLDGDPIDVAVDSNVIANLNHAVPFNDSVIQFSSAGQFSLDSNKILSPNDVSINSTTTYSSVSRVRPIPLGNSVYFLNEAIKGMNLREYNIEVTSEANIATEVSAHVHGYIPTDITSMVGNTNQDIIILSAKDTDTVYVYKFFRDGENRIQSAWGKWVFGGSIKGISMLGKYLYLIIDRGQGSQLERLDYSTSKEGINYLDNGTIEYESSLLLSETVLLDRNGRVILSAGSPLMYKSLQLKSTTDSVYDIVIKNKLRTRIASGFAVKDNKILLQGKTTEVELKIQSVSNNPLEFHTYTTELLYNTRASN